MTPAAGTVGTFDSITHSMRDRQKTFLGASVITIGLNGVAAVIMGLASILISRAIGPEQTGRLAWFTAGTAMAALFADLLGIYYSNAQLIASGRASKEPSVVRGSILGYGLLVGMAGGSLVGLAPFVRGRVFPGYTGSIWSWLIFLNIAGSVLVNQVRGIYLGERNYFGLSSILVVRSALYAGLAFVVLSGGQTQASWIAVGQVAATWSCVAGAAVQFSRTGGIGAPSTEHLSLCLHMGRRAAALNWLGYLHQRFDQYLVNSRLGASALGLYSVAVSLGELINQIPGTLGMVLFPIVAADHDQAEAARSTLRRTFVVMAFATAVVSVVCLFRTSIISAMFGQSFVPAADVWLCYAPAVISLSGLLMFNQHLAGSGYPNSQVGAAALALVLNLTLNFVLLGRYPSPWSAAIAGSASFTIWLMLIAVVMRARTRTNPHKPAEPPELIDPMASSPALLSVRNYWNEQPCGTQVTQAERLSAKYFDEVEEHRYRWEPEIFSFAQFTRYHGRRILEVGVGAGTDFLQWVRAGCRASGIDLTPAGIDHVRQRLALNGLRAEDLRVANAESLPYADDSFDLVYSWGVIHHSPNTEQALREIVRVCRPGGRCKVMVYNRRSYVALYMWIKWALLKGNPWRSVRECLANYVESPGTKAYTIDEVRTMLGGLPVQEVAINTILTGQDRLTAYGFLYRLFARALVSLVGIPNRGFYLTVEFRKAGAPGLAQEPAAS